MLPRVGLGLLMIAALLGFAVSAPASAQTSLGFAINTTADAVDINIGDGICNTGAAPGDECSLRAAIQEGNAFAGQTFIGVNNSGGVMGLSIPRAVPTTDENLAATGDLDITGDIEIGGPGTVNGGTVDRIFHVQAGGSLRLNSLNVANGNVSGENGGGILVTGVGSFLEIDFSEVFGNTASVLATLGGRGGGIRIEFGATAEIDGASIRNNISSNPGAGISVNQAGLTLKNTTITTNNVTGGSGGGITIQNDTSSGILPELKYAILNNVTIADNDSTSGAGGMMNFGDINPTVSNTVFSGNQASGSPVDCGFSTNASFAFTSLGANLVTNGTGCTGTNVTDFVGVTSGLAAASAINGITHHKPSATSSNVVNAGNVFSCEPRDATGTLRPQGSGCDIGAIELKVGFAGGIQATPVVALGQLVTVTVVDPDLRFASQVSITAITRVNDIDFESEVFTLDATGSDGVLTGTFLVQLNSVPAPTNGIIDIIGEGMITFLYVDLPNGNGEFNVSNRIFQTQVSGLQGDLVANSSFELDANADKIPDSWKGVGLSGDKRRCNTLTKTFAFDGVCAFEMKNPTGNLTQKLTLPLPANIDDDMFLEVLVDTKVARPGIIASIKIKESDGDVESCKINLLAGTNSGAGGYQSYQCNVEPDLDQVTSVKIVLTTASMPTGKILFDRVSLLTINPRLRSAGVDGVLPPPSAPSGFRGR